MKVNSIDGQIDSNEVADLNAGSAISGRDTHLILADGEAPPRCALNDFDSHDVRRMLQIDRISRDLFEIPLKPEIIQIARQ